MKALIHRFKFSRIWLLLVLLSLALRARGDGLDHWTTVQLGSYPLGYTLRSVV